MIRRNFLKALAALGVPLTTTVRAAVPRPKVARFVDGKLVNGPELLAGVPFVQTENHQWFGIYHFPGVEFIRSTTIWVCQEHAVAEHYGEMILEQRIGRSTHLDSKTQYLGRFRINPTAKSVSDPRPMSWIGMSAEEVAAIYPK